MLCATYGISWATMHSVRSFWTIVFPGSTLPAGLVVVCAPRGEALERCTPVFMYAWLFRHTYTKSCCLSTAPDSAWKPMSYVPPSPANATNL